MSIDIEKSFSAKPTNVSPDPDENETTPDALVVPTNCLLNVISVSEISLLSSVNKVFTTSLGSLKIDCNFSGSCNLAPVNLFNCNLPSPPSTPSSNWMLIFLSDDVCSSEKKDWSDGSKTSKTISAIKSCPLSDSCICMALASLSFLIVDVVIVKSVLLEFSTMRSDSPPSDTLIFSPD